MSKRNILYLIVGVVLFGAGAFAGVMGYVWTVGGSGEPSAPISAPTLSLDATATPNAEATIANLSTEVAQLQQQLANSSLEQTSSVVATAVTATPEVSTSTDASNRALFRIASDQSQVSFTLTEDLMGAPKTVVGTTDQVAGDIIVDFSTPANSQIGLIRINARSLTTDSENRNRALRSQILQSSQDQYEYIEFTPTSLSGLPASVTVGQPFTVQVTGDLKIRDIVKPVTFDTTITPVSDTQLQGSGQTTVQRADFNLQIPNVPSVANVSEAVTLQIDFAAAKVEA